MATSKSKKKADLKVVILGEASVGKTSFIHRYLEHSFLETGTTIGASFSLKQWGSYNVAIWDTAGEEKFAGLSSFYCRGAGAAIMAYDMTSEDSFHTLRARFKQLLDAAEDGCLVVIIGMKKDLITEEYRPIPQQDPKVLAKELNTRTLNELPCFETSSKTGHNVDRAFQYIFETCLPIDDSGNGLLIKGKMDKDVVDLETKDRVHQPKRCC